MHHYIAVILVIDRKELIWTLRSARQRFLSTGSNCCHQCAGEQTAAQSLLPCRRLTDNPSPGVLQLLGYSSWHLPAAPAGSHSAPSWSLSASSRLRASVPRRLRCPAAARSPCSSTCLWECRLGLLPWCSRTNQTAGQGGDVSEHAQASVCFCVWEVDPLNLWAAACCFFFHVLQYFLDIHILLYKNISHPFLFPPCKPVKTLKKCA